MSHADLLSPVALTDPQPFVIAGHEFRSRLMVGTGKYASNAQMIEAIEASGAEVVTVATIASFLAAVAYQVRRRHTVLTRWPAGVITTVVILFLFLPLVMLVLIRYRRTGQVRLLLALPVIWAIWG